MRAPEVPRSVVLDRLNQVEADNLRQAAEKLGMGHDALRAAVSRARRAGIDHPVLSKFGYARRRSSVAAEWNFLRKAGVSIHAAARLLDTSVEDLQSIQEAS